MRGSAKAWRPSAKRRTSAAPASASAALPAAIPSEVAMDPAVVTLATNAPRKIAGHHRCPPSTSAASAIPVGGQSGVALAWTTAK